jgi:hypothetical protein
MEDAVATLIKEMYRDYKTAAAERERYRDEYNREKKRADDAEKELYELRKRCAVAEGAK